MPEPAEDLMSVLGHELRSPLTAIRGAATLLLMSPGELAPEKVEELLRLIDERAAAMADRIEDVLVASRLQAGTPTVMSEPVELADVLADGVEMARRHGRRVSARVPPGLRVTADEQRLAQVLRALIDNAIRFSPAASSIDLRVTADSDLARVEVRDRGPGVAADDRERVFARGVKLDPSGPGAGLGLHVARGLVAAMGGAVGVAPRSGGGSVFWFTLPAAK